MAVTVVCDQCTKLIHGEVFRRGYVIKREYCENCVEYVDKMQEEIDLLHTNLADQWRSELKKIRDNYSLEGGLLPDVSI